MNEDRMTIEVVDGRIYVDGEEPLSIEDLMSELDKDLPPFSETAFDKYMGQLSSAFAELETHHNAGVLPNVETAMVVSRIEDAAGWLAILVEQAIAGRIEEAE